MSNVGNKEISWDILGYYLPLPSTFIYNQPLLNNIDWLKKVNEEKQLSGTLYMVSSNDKGEPMYFFLLGMALLYLPFFLIGHEIAMLFSYPVDGFSEPYQYAMVIGAIIYTLIGLYYLRKNLLHFFSERVSSLVLIIIVFGTNYINHLTIKNLETVNVLFMLTNIVLWYTIKWHENQKSKYLVTIAVTIAITALVKPSEIVIAIIPLLWNVYSLDSLKNKLNLLQSSYKQILIACFAGLLIVSPQIIYWLIKTGSPIYDSYKNAGVGLDFTSPHIIDSLFSYRKGWLLYTPIMIFSLIGFLVMYKRNRNIFFPITVYFLIAFYIISSWSEWWYGASFSNRPIIATYPFLAIALGYFIEHIKSKKYIIKILIGALSILLIAFNQFQWWQLKNYIIHPHRITKAYYWATFLKTSVSAEDKKLLLVKRNYSGEMEFNNQENYTSTKFKQTAFDNTSSELTALDSNNNRYYQALEKDEFILTEEIKFKELTKTEHVWVVASFDARFNQNFNKPFPCFVITMNREEGNYHYFAPPIIPAAANEWQHFQFEYLTPEIRDVNDKLKYYFWNRSKGNFDIDNLLIEIYEKKPLE